MTMDFTAPTTGEAGPRDRAASLRGLCGGAVHLPGDPGYDTARMPWNVAVDQRPAAVAGAANSDHVRDVVRAAAAAGLRVAPQGSGHNPGPLGSLEDAVLLRTSAMTGVGIDPERKIARVEAGVLWQDVVEAAAAHGLAALHGSSPDVGVVGYSLGGGIGWYARELGMATNSVTSVDLILPDGSLVRTDEYSNPELFWALRGGGGNFGIVTALEFRLFPIETAYAGILVWDQRRAGEVLHRWVEWCESSPDTVTTSFRMLNVPPLPEVPEMLRGRQVAVIDGAVLGTDEEAEAILGQLRALGPEIDTFARVPAASLTRLHMDPEGPTPAVTATDLLATLPEEAMEAYLSLTGPDSGTSLLFAELRQLGGALGRPHPGAGALPMLDGKFLLFAVAIAATPEMAQQGHADATAVAQALAPYSSGRKYLNFTESAVEMSDSFPEATWQQLKGIRTAADPNGLLQANHPVPRLYEDGRPTK